MKHINTAMKKIIKEIKTNMSINAKNKSRYSPFVIIKQCKNCGKMFGYVPQNYKDNFEYCCECEKEQGFNNFINSFNFFKNKGANNAKNNI